MNLADPDIACRDRRQIARRASPMTRIVRLRQPLRASDNPAPSHAAGPVPPLHIPDPTPPPAGHGAPNSAKCGRSILRIKSKNLRKHVRIDARAYMLVDAAIEPGAQHLHPSTPPQPGPCSSLPCSSRWAIRGAGLAGISQVQQPEEIQMAKGQTRSNREIRKPKQAPKPKTSPMGSTVSSTFEKPSPRSGKQPKK